MKQKVLHLLPCFPLMLKVFLLTSRQLWRICNFCPVCLLLGDSHAVLNLPLHIWANKFTPVRDIHIPSSFFPKEKTNKQFWFGFFKQTNISCSFILHPQLHPHLPREPALHIPTHHCQCIWKTLDPRLECSVYGCSCSVFLLTLVSKRDLFIQSAVHWKLLTYYLYSALSCALTTASGAFLLTHSLTAVGLNFSSNPSNCCPSPCCKPVSSNQNTSGHCTVSQSHLCCFI